MRSLLSIVLLLTLIQAEAQVGIGTNTPHSSAALEIKDSTKGILIPRMTMEKRKAIAVPAEGLMVYQTDSTKGYWYFDGAQWKNMSQANFGGKRTISLGFDITNQEAQAKIAAEYGPNTEEIIIQDCIVLTDVDLSMVTKILNIRIYDNKSLISINLQNLKICEGQLDIEYCPKLNSVNLNLLEKVYGSFYCAYTNVSILSLPAITKLSRCIIQNNTLLTTFSVPLLSTVGTFNFTYNNAISSLSFPALKSTIGLTDYWSIASCQNLSTIALDNLTVFDNLYFEVLEAKLPSSQVNYLLHKFVSITPALTGKSFLFNQTPDAPPTGQGIIDKATLIANGNTVGTD